jgi:hypothetical protein
MIVNSDAALFIPKNLKGLKLDFELFCLIKQFFLLLKYRFRYNRLYWTHKSVANVI